MFAQGGFWLSAGTTLGAMAIRILVDGSEASGATRNFYPAVKSTPHFVETCWASHMAAAEHNVVLQYSAAQAFVIYNRNLVTLWG
jgi:hypothetical protein